MSVPFSPRLVVLGRALVRVCWAVRRGADFPMAGLGYVTNPVGLPSHSSLVPWNWQCLELDVESRPCPRDSPLSGRKLQWKDLSSPMPTLPPGPRFLGSCVLAPAWRCWEHSQLQAECGSATQTSDHPQNGSLQMAAGGPSGSAVSARPAVRPVSRTPLRHVGFVPSLYCFRVADRLPQHQASQSYLKGGSKWVVTWRSVFGFHILIHKGKCLLVILFGLCG